MVISVESCSRLHVKSCTSSTLFSVKCCYQIMIQRSLWCLASIVLVQKNSGEDETFSKMLLLHPYNDLVTVQRIVKSVYSLLDWLSHTANEKKFDSIFLIWYATSWISLLTIHYQKLDHSDFFLIVILFTSNRDTSIILSCRQPLDFRKKNKPSSETKYNFTSIRWTIYNSSMRFNCLFEFSDRILTLTNNLTWGSK